MDEDLVMRLRAKDEAAFEQIVRSWSPLLIRVARRYVASGAAAEEVVQETWLAMITGLDRYEGRATLRTWTLGICVNIARRRGVRDSRTVTIPFDTEADERGPTVDPTRFRPPDEQWAGFWNPQGAPRDWGPEASLLTAEVRDLVRNGLHALPHRQGTIVALSDLHGLPTTEIADLLGLSAGNVRVLLHRGRVRLRKQLEAYVDRREAVTTP